MKLHKLSEFPTGWYLGAFSPTLHHTEDFEIAYKTFKRHQCEHAHTHKIATEFNLITRGTCIFTLHEKDLKTEFLVKSKSVFVIEPNECFSFEAITNVELCIIKIPGNGWKDKFLAS